MIYISFLKPGPAQYGVLTDIAILAIATDEPEPQPEPKPKPEPSSSRELAFPT